MFITIHRIPLKSEEEEERKRMLSSLVSTGRVSCTQYDDLPSSYIKDEWPSKCNLICANCSYSSNRTPFFIPIGRRGDVFTRGGGPIFCSPSCASYMVLQIADSSTRNRKMSLVIDLAAEMLNSTDVIVPSADPFTLKKFGGTASDLDYQNDIYSLNKKMIERMYTNRSDLIDELSP